MNAPDPNPNKILNIDGSDDCTIVVANTSKYKSSPTQASDDKTASTQPSTEEEASTSDVGNLVDDTPEGTFISQHALPWGGTPSNKLTGKWTRRIAEREKGEGEKRQAIHGSNPEEKFGRKR